MTRICQKILLLIGLVGSFCAIAADDADELWKSSPHADSSSPSFTHWDDEGVIPGDCASCHSGTGFLDYLGADESSPFDMDKEHATGSLVDCQSCHNPTAKELDSVTFPSGVVVSDIGSSATCMVCHQGRSSTGTTKADLLPVRSLKKWVTRQQILLITSLRSSIFTTVLLPQHCSVHKCRVVLNTLINPMPGDSVTYQDLPIVPIAITRIRSR